MSQPPPQGILRMGLGGQSYLNHNCIEVKTNLGETLTMLRNPEIMIVLPIPPSQLFPKSWSMGIQWRRGDKTEWTACDICNCLLIHEQSPIAIGWHPCALHPPPPCFSHYHTTTLLMCICCCREREWNVERGVKMSLKKEGDWGGGGGD